jgi:hypothetical protein
MNKPFNPTERIPVEKRQELLKKYERELLISRLRDYDRENTDQLRLLLIERWKREHPDAAVEESTRLKPLMKHYGAAGKQKPDEPDETWCNDLYYITLRRVPDHVFGSPEGMVQLGIASHDGTARHDWRHFQEIKNALAGPECEAFELYPAESRLLDPSNYYTLWCFPGVRRLKIGVEVRDVRDRDAAALAPQRALPK